MIEFCVYKHTSPTGKVYVGITSRDPPQLMFGVIQPRCCNFIHKVVDLLK